MFLSFFLFFFFFFFFFFFYITATTEDPYPLEAESFNFSIGIISIIAVSKFTSASIGLVLMDLVSVGPVWFGSVSIGFVVVLPMDVSLLS